MVVTRWDCQTWSRHRWSGLHRSSSKPVTRLYAGLTRRALAFLFTALVLALIGCSGDVSRVTVTLGDSAKFSRTDLQGAADAVLAQFGDFEGCTLLQLSYDEDFSMRQVSLAAPRLP